MNALLIEFDGRTGERAGRINPRDPNLPCRGWQNLEVTPALEIRLVTDDRDLSFFEEVPGVTVLEGKEAINAAIKEHIPVRYKIVDSQLMREHLKEKGLSLDDLVGKGNTEVAAYAVEHQLAGVIEIKPDMVV